MAHYPHIINSFRWENKTIGQYLNIPESTFLITWKDVVYYEKPKSNVLMYKYNNQEHHNLIAKIPLKAKPWFENKHTLFDNPPKPFTRNYHPPVIPLSMLFPVVPTTNYKDITEEFNRKKNIYWQRKRFISKPTLIIKYRGKIIYYEFYEITRKYTTWSKPRLIGKLSLPLGTNGIMGMIYTNHTIRNEYSNRELLQYKF